VYLEKAFDGSGCIPEQRFLNAKRLSETSLMFLCHPMPTQTEVDLISHVLAEVVTE
jgi:dTDP-4-amino-4,6-dideoxygalactose transaminase